MSKIKTSKRVVCVSVVCLSVLFVLFGCSSAPRVERQDIDTTIDLSGRWNDTDSQMVSKAMIEDCLRRPWIEDFKEGHQGETPTVIVGQVVNRSHEHINMQTFVKDLERNLINSGRVRFVAAAGEREQVREERLDMATHASDETMKTAGKEIGADFMLIGSINTIRDAVDGKAVMYYQTNLELVDLENNLKVWIGEQKIKKLIEQPKFRW